MRHSIRKIRIWEATNLQIRVEAFNIVPTKFDPQNR